MRIYREQDFPKRGKYKTNKHRISFITDFVEGEEIYFKHTSGNPQTTAEGYAFYTNGNQRNLIHITEVEIID